MTSSGTSTDSKPSADPASRAERSAPSAAGERTGKAGEAAEAGGERWGAPRVDLVIAGTLLIGGWVAILQINDWHVGPPVVFLFLGWTALLASARFLWTSGMAIATGDADDDEGFDFSTTHREDLVREKKALLKAIKEAEFDHAMGKLSDTDAAELIGFYRRRAIEIIKELEVRSDDGDLSFEEMIDRELRARLAVDKPRRKGAGGGKKKGAAKAGEPKGAKPAAPEEPVEKAKPTAKAQPVANSESEDPDPDGDPDPDSDPEPSDTQTAGAEDDAEDDR